MDRKCEGCTQEAKIICFCRNVLLCELCIGRHLMSEESVSHKPCTLNSENLKMYEENIKTLRENEELLLGQARKRQELAQAYRSKLNEGLTRLNSLHAVILDYVTLAAELARKQLPEIAEKLSQEMISKCQGVSDTVTEALQHFNGEEQHSDNEVVRLLESLQTPGEVIALELLTCRLDIGEISLEHALRSGIHFELALKKGTKSSPPPKPTLFKSNLPKKTVAKPANRPVSATTKGLHSQNTAVKDHPSDKKPGNKKKTESTDPKMNISESHLKQVPVPVEHPEVYSASPEPRQPPEATVLRKLGTEVPETSLERSRLARLQNRQDQLKATEQRVLSIEEQIRAFRPKSREYPES